MSPLRRLYVGARVDYQLNAKNTLMVRYEPNLNTSQNAGIGNFTLPSEGVPLVADGAFPASHRNDVDRHQHGE